MMTTVLRRSSLLVPRRTLAAALTSSVESFLHHHFLADAASSGGQRVVGANGGIFGELGSLMSKRSFYVKSGRLDFRASGVSCAEFAVQGYDSPDNVSSDFDGAGSDEGLEVSKLGIAEEIVKSLSGRGITKLFPIQRAVLEPAMQGRDMIGRAKTGTGKTLAFGIPILDRIIRFNAKHGRGRNPLCLVLAPTRELAKQVEKEFRESAPSLDAICLYGGTPIGRQMRELDYGVDIAVGTPGRIIDLLKRGALDLSEVQFVVLDEADQMLQVGFAEDVEVILEKLPKKRQSMMFSATMPNWIRSLTQRYLVEPVTIDLVGDSDQKLAEGISLYSIVSDMYGKASVIGPLVTEHAKGGKCIVFTQTKRDADRLAFAMGRNYRCEALHGDISQSQRERTLSGFREGHFNILVATDVAARGLDIPNVDLVIHYELPNSSEIFVHRTGRTGRAGKKGSAILIYTQEQARSVRLIERDVGCKFTELPRMAVERDGGDMFGDIGGGLRGTRGDRRYGDSGFGRIGGGQSGFRGGRSGGYGNQGFGGRPGGFSGEPGGRYGSASNRFGDFGGSRSGGGSGFGGRSGGFGSPDRTPSFGNLGSPDRSSGFGNFGSSNAKRFGEFGSARSSRPSGGPRSGGFGSFGDTSVDDDKRRPF